MRWRSSATDTVAVPRFPTTTAAAGIGRAHGGFEIGAHRQHGGEHRDHGVAGAGHVAHAHRIGRHVHRRADAHQRHALLAARDQHGLGVDRLGQRGRGDDDLVVVVRRRVRRLGEFLPVRRDQRRPAIDAVIAALWIDHDRLAELCSPHRSPRGSRAASACPWHSRRAPRRRPAGSALSDMRDQRVLGLRHRAGTAASQSARNRCVE